MTMQLYAKQARTRQLEADAFEIRLRAEARVGEMMAAQPKSQAAWDQSVCGSGFSKTRSCHHSKRKLALTKISPTKHERSGLDEKF